MVGKRMFLTAEARGESGARFGFRWCATCRGRGEVCLERVVDGKHTAGFELCSVCRGDRVLATQASASDAGA